MGISGEGDNALVDGNEIAYNNTAYFDYSGTNGEAGGTKFICAVGGHHFR